MTEEAYVMIALICTYVLGLPGAWIVLRETGEWHVALLALLLGPIGTAIVLLKL